MNKKLIVDTIKDSVAKLFYYDRKEDEELGVGEIEEAVRNGIITKEEIVSIFINALDSLV